MQSFNNKNILVTGAAGYIGSHCAKFLLENGYNVTALDNLSLGHLGAIKQLENIANEKKREFKFHEIDLDETDKVGEILKDKIGAVIHFAAFSQVGESVKNPLKYYINNTGKTALLLNEMIKADVKKIVFSSTAAVYGIPDEIPIQETAVSNPINPYGKSKLMIEKIMDAEDKANGLKSISLRYFNVAGASSDGKLGEVHNPETHLIPNVLKTVASDDKGATFKLFGDDYDTRDGTAIRDYIHVEDLVYAHFLALKKLLKENISGVYNLGSSKGCSVKEVYDVCCQVTGKNIPLEIQGRREGDPPILVASNEKAEKELKFKPEKSLEDMILSAWNWALNPKF